MPDEVVCFVCKQIAPLGVAKAAEWWCCTSKVPGVFEYLCLACVAKAREQDRIYRENNKNTCQNENLGLRFRQPMTQEVAHVRAKEGEGAGTADGAVGVTACDETTGGEDNVGIQGNNDVTGR